MKKSTDALISGDVAKVDKHRAAFPGDPDDEPQRRHKIERAAHEKAMKEFAARELERTADKGESENAG